MVKYIVFSMIGLFFTGCALREPSWNYVGDIKAYKFARIANTQIKKVEEGSLVPVYGVGWVGVSEGESLDPKQAIAGELMKYGFLIVDEAQDEKTLFVSYGENGNSDFPEVSIQMIDLKTKQLVYSCNADGSSFMGTISGIKQAISRCLSGLKAYFVSQTKNQKDEK